MFFWLAPAGAKLIVSSFFFFSYSPRDREAKDILNANAAFSLSASALCSLFASKAKKAHKAEKSHENWFA